MKVIKPQRKIPASNKEVFIIGSPVLCEEHIYTMKVVRIEYGAALCEWHDDNGKKWEKEFNLIDLKIIL